MEGDKHINRIQSDKAIMQLFIKFSIKDHKECTTLTDLIQQFFPQSSKRF